MRPSLLALLAICCLVHVSGAYATAAEKWATYEGGDGPGDGRHVVLISGDEEYRSEEALPQLGRILAKRHGFRCTVLFAINPDTGEIDPETLTNIPGLHHLEDADLMVIFTRFRRLPDGQMRHIDDYLKSGRPVVGLRTSTHGFKFPEDSEWARYSDGYNGPKEAWRGGFGRLVLGERWIAHHGAHRVEATRGIIPDQAEEHPIANGIDDGDVFGLSDVYRVRLPLPGNSEPIVLGQVVAGMDEDAPAVEGRKNDPMMPVAWTKSYQLPEGEKGRVFATTMGASVDMRWEGTRRMLVNGCFWALGMDVLEEADVGTVGEFDPTMYGFGEHREGLRPSDFEAEDRGRP